MGVLLPSAPFFGYSRIKRSDPLGGNLRHVSLGSRGLGALLPAYSGHQLCVLLKPLAFATLECCVQPRPRAVSDSPREAVY